MLGKLSIVLLLLLPLPLLLLSPLILSLFLFHPRWETVEQPLVMMAGKHFCSRLRWALISQTTSSVKISLATGLSQTEGPPLCTPRHLSIPLLDRVKVLHCIQPIALAKMFNFLRLIFLICKWGVVKYLLHRNSMRMSYYMYISWNSACRHSIGKY